MRTTRYIRPIVRSQEERNALVVDNLRLVPYALFHTTTMMKKLATILGSDDAVQEAHVALIHAADIWDGGNTFATYALNQIRWRLLRLYAKRTLLETVSMDGVNVPATDQDRQVEAAETREVIEDALRTLMPRERIVLTERMLNGKTLAECAKLLNVTRERARQIEIRSMRKLRDRPRCDRLLELIDLFKCVYCSCFSRWHRACPICATEKCERCVTHRTDRYGSIFSCEACYLGTYDARKAAWNANYVRTWTPSA